MPSFHRIWQEFVALWPIIGPTLGVVAGVVGKWLLDLLSKELSSRREYRQKMISLMIPKLHEYAEKYYMHEGAYADRSARDLKESLKESPVSDQQLVRTMFHLGKFLHALDERQRAIPAYFLQDVDAEAKYPNRANRWTSPSLEECARPARAGQHGGARCIGVGPNAASIGQPRVVFAGREDRTRSAPLLTWG